MTQSVIGALRVNLGLNSAAFSSGLRDSQSRMRRFSQSVRTGMAVATVAAAAFAVAFGRSMNRAIAHADDMYKASQALGTSTESLTQLAHAAEMSGSSFETLQTGLRRVSTALEDVASGSQGPTARAFEALGISAQNANGSLRSVDDVVGDVAEAFARMQDGAEKTAAANAIFGRSGAQLIPMLNAGRDGIQAMREEADRLGITISERAGRSAEAFRDNLSRLRRAFIGIRNHVAEALLPVFERFSEALVTLSNDQELVKGIAEGLVEVFKRVAIAALNVTKYVYGLIPALEAAAGGVRGFEERYYAGQDRVAAMHARIDQLIASINDDTIISNSGIARRIAQSFEDAAGTVAQAGSSIRTTVETEIGEPMQLTTDAMRQNLQSIADESRQTANSMGDYFGGVFSGLIDGTQKWGDALRSVLGRLASNSLSNGISQGFQLLGSSLGGQGSGLFSGISSLLGFSTGTNWTGPGRSSVKGLVHGEEAVIEAPYAQRFQPEIARMRRGMSPGGIGVSSAALPLEVIVRVQDDGRLAGIAQSAGAQGAVRVINENNRGLARERRLG